MTGVQTCALPIYIDQAGKLEELTDQLYEGLTGISFDGMYKMCIRDRYKRLYKAEYGMTCEI